MKNLVLTLMSLFGVVIFTGCKDTSGVTSNVSGFVVDAKVGDITKYAGGDVFEAGDKIVLYGTPSGVALAGSDNFIDGSGYTRRSDYFVKEGAVDAFPVSGSLDLYGIYFGTYGVVGGPLGYEFVTVSNQSGVGAMLGGDVLITKKTGVGQTLEPIELSFTHAMSKLVLNVELDAQYKANGVTVSKVLFKNLSDKVSVNLSSGVTLVDGSSVADVVPSRSAVGGVDIFEAIVAPQGLVANQVFGYILLSNGKSFDFSIDKDWILAQGKRAIFDVSVQFGGGKVIVVGAGITDWADVNIGSGSEVIVDRLFNRFDCALASGSTTWSASTEVSLKIKYSGDDRTTVLKPTNVVNDATNKVLSFEFRGLNNLPQGAYQIVSMRWGGVDYSHLGADFYNEGDKLGVEIGTATEKKITITKK